MTMHTSFTSSLMKSHPAQHDDSSEAESSRGWPHIIGLGTTLPRYRWSKTQCESTLAALWSLQGIARARWQRICRGTQIEHRYSVLPVEDVIDCSTAERMAIYAREAPALAVRAAEQAMQQAHMDVRDITDLVVVTCTGFAAPGLDVALVDQLRLPAHVRRVQVGFMGCFGAITGLRTAIGACAADPNARVLLACCELCTLHVRRDSDIDNQVASALFGDGAAAAVIANDHYVQTDDARRGSTKNARRQPPALRLIADDASPIVVGDDNPPAGTTASSEVSSLGRVGLGQSLLLAHGRAWMTWRITDRGFMMTLDRKVPEAMRRALQTALPQVCDESTSGTLLVHPGGPGIIDAVADASGRGMHDAGLRIARDVLRTCGNVSSGTILFVLQRALRAGLHPPFTLLAFGPGLTIESLPVHSDTL